MIVPNGVDQVVGGPERNAAIGKRFVQLFYLVIRVQPHIKTDFGVVRSMVIQPITQFGFGPVDGGEMGSVHLFFDLYAITAIDEDSGNFGQHRAKPGGTCEAGQPRKAGVAGGHIFALMGVGAGDQETGEIGRMHGGAQGGKSGRAVCWVGGFGEVLKHRGRSFWL